jgi:hypothetical protein
VEGNLSVLVASCDAYADLWRPFFTLFRRYWPDCPYPVYLGSNFASHPDPELKHVHIGEDRDWALGFRAMLEAMPTDRVLVLLEDYLLTAPADTARIKRLAGHMRERDAGCLRLVPVPGAPSPDSSSPEVGELPRGMSYRVSLQAAVWDRATLLELVTPGESPWQLEHQGSGRSDVLPQPFLSVVQGAAWPLPYFATAVVRGVWLRDAVALCRSEGVPVDLAARPVGIARRLRAAPAEAAAPAARGREEASLRGQRREPRRE